MECYQTMVVRLPTEMRPEREMDEAVRVPKKMRPNPEMDEGEFQRELPEEMLEVVVAKMPFPSLFKARSLSRSWYSKFSSQRLTGLSCEASVFQSEVSANSTSWQTYSPVYVNWTNKSLLAIDDKTKSHCSILLPPNLWPSEWMYRGLYVWLAGALILVVGVEPGPPEYVPTYSVGNVVTGSCRHVTLPPLLGSGMYMDDPGPLTLIALGCDTYKVFAVHYVTHSWALDLEMDAVCVNLYDSNSQCWTSTLNKLSDNQHLNGFDYFLDDTCAYKDGKVYFLAQYEGQFKGMKLVSYDLETTAWTIVVGEFADELPKLHVNSGVFRCGDNINVVVWSETVIFPRMQEGEGREESFITGNIKENSIQVFQLDMQSLDLVSISHGPPRSEVLLEIYEFSALPNPKLSADANFLYFGWDCLSSFVVKFDLNNREWGSSSLFSLGSDFSWKGLQVDWIHGVFEPGVNPFVSA